jgi:hypothetical protein
MNKERVHLYGEVPPFQAYAVARGAHKRSTQLHQVYRDPGSTVSLIRRNTAVYAHHASSKGSNLLSFGVHNRACA